MLLQCRVLDNFLDNNPHKSVFISLTFVPGRMFDEEEPCQLPVSLPTLPSQPQVGPSFSCLKATISPVLLSDQVGC